MPQRQMNLIPATLPRKETPKAALAFEKYYDLGEQRTLRALSRQIGTSLSQLGIWSRAHHWQERVAERDHKEMERKRKRREAEQEKMNEEHAAWGKAMAAMAMAQIKRLIDARAFNAQATVMLFKYATDLQRLAMGNATETLRLQLQDAEGNLTDASRLLPSIMVYLPRKEDLGVAEEGYITEHPLRDC